MPRLTLCSLVILLLVGCTEEVEPPPVLDPPAEDQPNPAEPHLDALRTSSKANPPQSNTEAMDALVALGPQVVPRLRQELEDPERTDPRYRCVLVATVARIPGPQALELLKRSARDLDPRVRANAYVGLSTRKAKDEWEQAYVVLLKALASEPDIMARTVAAARIRVFHRSAWPLIMCLRDAPMNTPNWRPFRQACLESLRHISGKTEAQLPFDLAAVGPEAHAGIRRWEIWFMESGGVLPPGKDMSSKLIRELGLDVKEPAGKALKLLLRTRVTLYSLDPKGGQAGGFHGYGVLGKLELSPTDHYAVLAAVAKSVRESKGLVASCFLPRHGLRGRIAGTTVDLVICFQCAQLQVHGVSDGQTVPITDAARETLDRILIAAKIPRDER